MSQPQGTLQNLADGSQESLRALIEALIPEASANSNGKFSGDVVGKLTEKLSQLVGPDAVQDYKQSRNERGELVNEEGLPIIDINEPVDIATKLQSAGSIPPLATVEPLLPLATLPSSARERLRERRNRILDMLEQEEQETQQRQSEEAEEALQKRKEETMKERDSRKEARELQKKMGKALLQNMGKEKQREEQEREAQRLRDEEADKRRSPSIKKKTVAFVDSADNVEKDEKGMGESSSKIDWGDITPAKLQNTKRPTLLSQSLLDRHPMKMSVVERVPGQPVVPKAPSTPRQSGHRRPGFRPTSREIALEYYKKRNTIGQKAAAAMMNHTHEADEHPDPNPDLIPESTKPGISQFKANRIASAYSASIPSTSETPGTSLAGSVLPASSTRTIQRAIRTGKSMTPESSASEQEDEGLQEVLNLLRKGEVYNIGPDGNYIHAVRPILISTWQCRASTSQVGVTSTAQAAPTQADAPPPPNMRPKTSSSKPRAPRLADHTVSSVVAERIPSPFSMIVDSPSFPMPQQSQGQTVPPFSSSRRPGRPPPVLASSVVESRPTGQGADRASQDAFCSRRKRKFLVQAERMQ
ncbi:hypothetical protein BJ912DRAFT_953881 [Pholiota molesta]|nr:hypothetical protein BJ912DRAFT_953881 [Pholiota molesta]